MQMCTRGSLVPIFVWSLGTKASAWGWLTVARQTLLQILYWYCVPLCPLYAVIINDCQTCSLVGSGSHDLLATPPVCMWLRPHYGKPFGMGGSSCEETQCRGECLQTLCVHLQVIYSGTSHRTPLIRTFVNYTWSSPNFTIFLPKCGHLANQDFTSVSVRVIPLSIISNQSCEPLADNYTPTFAACLVIKCGLLVSWYLGYLTGERGFQSVKVGMDMVKETADCFKPVFCSCSVDRTWTYLLSWDLCFAAHYLYYGVVVSQINKSFVMLFRRQPNVWVCVCVSSCACVYVSVCYVCV